MGDSASKTKQQKYKLAQLPYFVHHVQNKASKFK